MADVLVAFDDSPQASAALRFALETFPEAELVVLHIINPAEYGRTPEATERAREVVESTHATAEAIGREYGADLSTAVEEGGTAGTIVEYAEENAIDHIVVGSHGREGLSRFLLGSVAETVVRRAPVSVTVIRVVDG